jgi:phage-related protein
MSVDLKTLTVHFYKNIRGRQPVRDWLLSIDTKDCRIIGEDIKSIEFGWPIGLPVCRSLGRGLYESRSNVTDGKIARVIFCVIGSHMMLLHGFIKKSQKTPVYEIDLAIKRKNEVLQ